MPDFDEFHESVFHGIETAVLAAAERGDPAAACETVLATEQFRQTVKRLPTLPQDVRRLLAHTCVEMYKTTEGQDRRHRILTMHAGLLARQVDLLETDGFETEMLAASYFAKAGIDGRVSATEAVLSSEDFTELVDRLRTFHMTHRNPIANNDLRTMYAEATDPERLERIIWMHLALATHPFMKEIPPLRDVVEKSTPEESTEILGLPLNQVAAKLAKLPRDARRRMNRNCADVLDTSDDQPRRKSALYMRAALASHPLEALGKIDLEPMIQAALESNDTATACEMILRDKRFHRIKWHLPQLIKSIGYPLLDKCVDLYESNASAMGKYYYLYMHAELSMLLDQPDDRLAAARQDALNSNLDHDYLRHLAIGMVWLELTFGRDIPVDLGTQLRRDSASSPAKHSKPLQRTIPLLAERYPVLNAGEPWSDRALAELGDLPAAWTELVKHAATATKPRPSAVWKEKGRALLAEVDALQFRDRVLDWLDLVPHPTRLSDFDKFNYPAASGLVWLLSLLPEHPRTVRGLSAVLQKSLRKAPGIGAAMPKLANACAHALSEMQGEAALAELARLTTRVTHKLTRKTLETGLNNRARTLGMSRDAIEELAVPDYGLTQAGHRTVRFGDARAELEIANGRAELHWYNAKGKAVKSAPAAVKHDHPEELKELKGQVKDIPAMLTAVAKRLDRQFLADREWTAQAWRERYLDHPLAGTLARRLIWTVDGTACRYTGGALRDITGEPVDVPAQAAVRLWHPLGHPIAEVTAWREQLEQERITQPFKQAHREIYLLTDAERRTATYSNRFAGHILRQHAFHALAAERNWRDGIRMVYDHNSCVPPAMRDLPEWGMRAEYRVRGSESDTDDASFAFELLAADRVEFYPNDAPEPSIGREGERDGGSAAPLPLPLADIPERVLSEVLRDVDLFVGVTSIGNDPTWQDGGPRGRFRRYWSACSFGDLSETARTRHDLLERLVPRLAIGDRCRIEGRFLHVKGERNTYKIHLGSGNILMDPGERYLCIVPADLHKSAPEHYLPFDGDRTLSLILSKAVMLADDTAITDPAILSRL